MDKYFEYPKDIYENLTKIRDKIEESKDLKKFSKDLKLLEKKITLFHAKITDKIIKSSKANIDFIGFHGQTIYHDAKQKISKQLGDGKLLSELTKKNVIYDFRKNDLENGGQGAPLTPIFHKLLIEQNKINLPAIILNLGGIANFTFIWQDSNIPKKNHLISADIGPGNCLIDQWMRKNSTKLYDKDGQIARSGKISKKIINKALDNNIIKNSYDIKDFDLLLFNKLSLEDGAASLVEYTVDTILSGLNSFLNDANWNKTLHILIAGGGRKNNFLVSRIKKKINTPVKLIDDLGIDGDFVESQAFAYLAIRSYLKLPISFFQTTGVKKPCTGGVIIKN